MRVSGLEIREVRDTARPAPKAAPRWTAPPTLQPMADTFPRQSARTRRFTLGEPRSFSVRADGSRVLFLRSRSGSDPHTGLWLLDAASGAERIVVDPARLGDHDEDLPPAERARRERVRETATGVVAYAADDAGRVVSFTAGENLWVVDVDDASTRELPARPGAYDPRPDPTGRWIAYVSGGTLRVIAVDGSGDRELAGDPDPAVSWGVAEFAAAEEMGRTRGYWWAPDGSALVVARVDETRVTEAFIADSAHPTNPPTRVRYPFAGTDNADVSLHLVGLTDGVGPEIRWDRAAYEYLVQVDWKPGHLPLLQVCGRDQRHMQVLSVDVATGETAVVASDNDEAWVEPYPGTPTWFADRLVRIRDVDGVRGLYVGEESVTDESYVVRYVAGVSDDAVVFAASRKEPGEIAVFAWTPADGVVPLVTEPGLHSAVHASGTTVVTSSSLDFAGQRHQVMTATASWPIASHAETPLISPSVRLLRLGKRSLPAGLVLPTRHRVGTKIPVLMDPYGGPHAQRVVAARRPWLEPQWWADQGFAVLVVDGRGTPGVGPAWEREVWHDFAGPVLDDQVDALHSAAELETDLDLTRVAIRGWSFGGYLAALAVLRRPDVFHAAVAGAPVADWASYDTHYTERYLGNPNDEPEVYRHNSLLADAASLRRPLLLIHGLADDNVLAAHTLLLSQRLTASGRPHSVIPLTGVTHMTPQEEVAENLLLLQLDFLRRALDGNA